MKVTWIINGKLQLILTPSDAKEEALLRELAQAPVEIQIRDTLQTGLDSHNNAAVITPKTAGS